MSEHPVYDIVILGAGIAGLSAADALIQKDKHCAIIDTEEPGSGSSGAPLMLLNPATGRRAKMAWKARECMEATLDLLNRVQEKTGTRFYEENGIVRPALTSKIAKDFQRAPEKYVWPDSNWVQWLDQEKFSAGYPLFKNHFGGLVIKKGATVDGALYMKSLSAYLMNQGLDTFYNRRYSLEQTQSGWQVIFDDGQILLADNVLFATGHSITQSKQWSFLPLNVVKGQAASFRFKDPLPLRESVSSLGYMAYLPARPSVLVAGSTYEHNYDHLLPDEDGLEALQKKLETILPGLAERSDSVKQWAGVRVTTGDRQPVLGEHPRFSGLYIFTALGSKGMVLGRYAAEILAKHIVSGNKIDDELSVARFV